MSLNLSTAKARSQRGASLIEALVALLVLALGVLGMARVHGQNLTESRNTNARRVAVQWAADLQERMKLNAPAIVINANPYLVNTGPQAKPAKDCAIVNCSPAELAAHDLWDWKARLAAALPAGDAQVFRSDGDASQVGVLVSWADTMARNQAWAAQTDAAQAAAYTSAQGLWLNTTTQGTGTVAAACPANRSCHLVFFRP